MVSIELPADVEERVSIATLAEADWPPALASIPLLGAVYELQPQGLQLDEPVAVSVRVEAAALGGVALSEAAAQALLLLRDASGVWGQLGRVSAEIEDGGLLVQGVTPHLGVLLATLTRDPDAVVVTLNGPGSAGDRSGAASDGPACDAKNGREEASEARVPLSSVVLRVSQSGSVLKEWTYDEFASLCYDYIDLRAQTGARRTKRTGRGLPI